MVILMEALTSKGAVRLPWGPGRMPNTPTIQVKHNQKPNGTSLTISAKDRFAQYDNVSFTREDDAAAGGEQSAGRSPVNRYHDNIAFIQTDNKRDSSV